MKVIHVARKPLAGTVAQTALKYGTGGLNIDRSRVGEDGGGTRCTRRDENGKCLGHPDRRGTAFGITIHTDEVEENIGRWPMNLVMTPEVVEEVDQQSARYKPPKADPKESLVEGFVGDEGVAPFSTLVKVVSS